MSNNEYDASHEQILREALGSAAEYRQATEADWEAFSQRRSIRRWPTWRLPLVVAASVVVLAVGITAIATGGFGLARHHAASGGAASAAIHEIAVPIEVEYYTTIDQDTARADGTPLTPHRVDPAAPEPGPAGVGLPAAPFLWLSFYPGKPPAARLSGILVLPDRSQVPAGGVDSDGSLLGYVTSSVVDADRSIYVWGAVGPEIAQLQISTPLYSNDAEPRASDDSAVWLFDADGRTSQTGYDFATSWTTLQEGWHAFAVQLPAGSRIVHLSATNPGAGLLQSISLDPITGQVTDTTDPSGPSVDLLSAETSGNVKNPAPITPAPDGDSVQAAADCIGSGRLSDPADPLLQGMGFDGGDLILAAGDDGMCFFDGRSWWSARVGGQSRAAQITDVGYGPEKALDAPQDRRTRFVFGMVSADVTAVTATVDGGIYTPLVGPKFGSSVRVFAIPVPATGDVAVIATGKDGAVLRSVTLPSIDDHATVDGFAPSANGDAGPYVGTYPDPNEGMQALVEGTVQVFNGCVAIIGDNGAGPYWAVPIFPKSQVEPAGAPAVLRYRGKDYNNGDDISIAGGFVGTPVPTRCGTNTYLVNPFD